MTQANEPLLGVVNKLMRAKKIHNGLTCEGFRAANIVKDGCKVSSTSMEFEFISQMGTNKSKVRSNCKTQG